VVWLKRSKVVADAYFISIPQTGSQRWKVAMMEKVILLVNGIITGVGVFMDIFGFIDLSRSTAALGLIIGIIDVISLIWMYRRRKDLNRRNH